MRDDTAAVVDRGGYPEAVTPWDGEPWPTPWPAGCPSTRSRRSRSPRTAAGSCCPTAVPCSGTCWTAAPAERAGQPFAPRPGRFTFFDWGDAAVSHPFCSLLVPARAARARYGAGMLPRLRDAYLEPWAGDGATAGELRRAVSLAWRLGAIGRAASWGRVFPEAAGTSTANSTNSANGHSDSARWLLELLAEPAL
ncbi:hypothetical protein [Streptomyces sp. NPDC004050]